MADIANVALTDTHCHLNHEKFEGDADAALARALETNVRRLLVVGYDLESSRRACVLARQSPAIEAVIGIHPETILDDPDAAFAELTAIAEDAANRVVAWGEIGLDYHWETVPRKIQARNFVAQIEIAVRLGLPIVIHCRDAYIDVLEILGNYPTLRAELHCFTGTEFEAARAIAQGLYLGAGGILTFKSSDLLRLAFNVVPLDRILIETDSPFLAPQAYRGKRNEPAYVTQVAVKLAEMRGLSVADVASATTANAERFFGPVRPMSNG